MVRSCYESLFQKVSMNPSFNLLIALILGIKGFIPILYILLLAPFIVTCQKDISDRFKAQNLPFAQIPPHKDSTPIVSTPNLLWKTYVGYGKVQLLVSKGPLHYCYLEKRRIGKKEFVLTSIDFRNGKKQYYKRDRLFNNSKPIVRNGILYYSGLNGFRAFHLTRGKELFSYGKGVFKGISRLTHENRLILLNAPSNNHENFKQIVCFDLSKHRFLWRKSLSNKRIYENNQFIFYTTKENVTKIYHKKTGKLLTRITQQIDRLKGKKVILKVDNHLLYLKINTKLLAIAPHKEKIIWKRDILNKYTQVIESFKSSVLLQNGPNLCLYNKQSGKLLWRKHYSGNPHKIISNKQITFITPHKVFGISLQTGEQVWEHNHLNRRNLPIYHKESYFYFKPMGNGEYLIKRLNPLSNPLETIFRIKDNGLDHYTKRDLNILNLGSLLFLGSTSGETYDSQSYTGSPLSLKAFDTQSGEKLWDYKAFKGLFLSHPQSAQSAVHVMSDLGKLVAFRPSTGKVLWEYHCDQNESNSRSDTFFKILKAHENVLYFYYNGYIYALNTHQLKSSSDKKYGA